MSYEPDHAKQLCTGEALNLLYMSTRVMAQQLNICQTNSEYAWKQFLKINYMLSYAVEERSRQLTEDAVITDAVNLNWRITHDPTITGEVQMALAVSDTETGSPSTSTVIPSQHNYLLDDWLEQARRMEALIIRDGYRIPAELLKLRIAQIGKMLAGASSETQTAKQREFKNLVDGINQAEDVLDGRLSPINNHKQSIIVIAHRRDGSPPLDIHQDKVVIGSRAWHWWMDVLRFVAGKYRGQDDYDEELEYEILAAGLLANERQTNKSEYSPENVLLDNRPPITIPGQDVQALVRLLRKMNGTGSAVQSHPDDWYGHFLLLEWNTSPDDTIIDGFVKAAYGDT